MCKLQQCNWLRNILWSNHLTPLVWGICIAFNDLLLVWDITLDTSQLQLWMQPLISLIPGVHFSKRLYFRKPGWDCSWKLIIAECTYHESWAPFKGEQCVQTSKPEGTYLIFFLPHGIFLEDKTYEPLISLFLNTMDTHSSLNIVMIKWHVHF